jgi:hypothetical protein
MARFSAQVWNELDDFAAVATVLRDACIIAKFGMRHLPEVGIADEASAGKGYGNRLAR